MNKQGQSVFQDAVLFLFIVVGVIVVAILASTTTPILQLFVAQNNVTGGMGIIASYFNLIMVLVMLFVGLILVFGGARQ